MLQEAVEKSEKDGVPVKVHVAQALVQAAVSGNIHAIKELMNRMDGMPKQQTDLTSGGEQLPAPIYGGKSVKV